MRHLFAIVLILTSIAVNGQSAAKANELFEKGHYSEAGEAYATLLKRSKSNQLYNYRYARCLQEQGRYKEALEYFAHSGTKYSLRYFFEGECYQQLWMTEEAVRSYNQYKHEAPHNDRIEYINKQIAKANMRQRYLKRVQKTDIIDSTVIHKNELLQAYKLSHTAGELKADTNGFVSYCNQRGDRCIYAAHSDNNLKLINTYKLLDQWSQPDTLDDIINFTSAQNYPYYMSDGITLYFAAYDTLGFGGWDIYISRYNSATNTFTTPENIGFPFNSEGDDYMYVIDEERQIGYFATDRFCHKDSVCVYRFAAVEEPQYLSSADNDSIMLYAQLLRYGRAQLPVLPIEQQQDEATTDLQTENNWQLAIYDDIVYTSYDDFVSDEARTLYSQYEEQLKQWQEQKDELAALRETYYLATEKEKEQLSVSIIELERKEATARQQIKMLLTRVRELEAQAISEKN